MSKTFKKISELRLKTSCLCCPHLIDEDSQSQRLRPYIFKFGCLKVSTQFNNRHLNEAMRWSDIPSSWVMGHGKEDKELNVPEEAHNFKQTNSLPNKSVCARAQRVGLSRGTALPHPIPTHSHIWWSARRGEGTDRAILFSLPKNGKVGDRISIFSLERRAS